MSFWQPSNESTLNIYAFQHLARKADVIFLGSSRIRYGISSMVVEREFFRQTGHEINVFNLGQWAGCIRTSYVVLRNVLKEEKRPKVVILEVADFGFEANNADLEDIYLKYYATPSDIIFSSHGLFAQGKLGPSTHGLLRDAVNLFRLPLRNPWQEKYREKLELLRTRGGSDVLFEELNLSNVEKALRDSIEDRRARYTIADAKKYKIAEDCQDAFGRFISLCHSRGIGLALIIMPLHANSYENPTDGETSTFEKYIARICQREGIEFLRLRDEIALDDDMYWGDYTHLSDRGAELASVCIAQRILIPKASSLTTNQETRCKLSALPGK